MSESRSKRLPGFRSVDEVVEFFENNDLGDYWEQMPEAHVDVDIKVRRHLFAVDEDLAAEVARIAQSRNMATAALVESWLWEKVKAQA